MGALAPMSSLRPHRLLRLVEEQARDEALSSLETPGDPVVSAGRRVEMVLRRRDRSGVTRKALFALLIAASVQIHAADSQAKRQTAFTLLWAGKYAQARAAFEDVLRQEPRDASARLGLAQSYYWSGDYRRAFREFERVLKTQPSNAEARRAADEIRAAARPGFAVGADAIDDDQPYRSGGTAARVYFFSDPLTKWEISGGGSRLRALDDERSTAEVALAGETTLPAIRTRIRAGLRQFRFPDGDARVLPSVTAERRLRTSSLTLRIERSPLLRSAPALRTHAWSDVLSARWGRENGSGLQFAAGAEHLRYFDQNSGWDADAYVLAPVSRALFLGASAAFRDTRESRFRIDSGRYDPYYTPQQLAEARAVGAFTLTRGRISASTHIDAGIARERNAGTFVPWRASLSLTMGVAPDVAFSVTAAHDSTAFYNANEIRAGLAGRF